MKRIIILSLTAMMLLPLTTRAQVVSLDNPVERLYKTFSVIGDSYSTFVGKTEPTTNAQYYPREGLDVYEPAQTWWMLFQREAGVKLEQNNSYSGGTICNTWWNGDDASAVSFVYREQNLREADLIIIEGGTNDSNANSPIGSYKYSDWTEQDLKSFRPALAKTIDYLQNKYPNSKLLFMLNNGLKSEINTSVNDICAHYGVPVMTLSGVSKALEHPTFAGMQAISRQLVSTLIADSDYLIYDESSSNTIRRAVENAKIFFQMPLYTGQWTTVCLPFALNEEQLQQVFGQGCVVAEYAGQAEISSEDPTEATMTFTKVSRTEAAKPYIVKPTLSRQKGITVEEFTLTTQNGGTTTGDNFRLTGSFRPTNLSSSLKTSFVVNKDGTASNVEKNTTLGAMHAYITAPSGIKKVSINIED
ncbi:MAG: hypothetical protein IJ196_01340 [Prevotella sp.]|nr:hypothetical protein [Prevotella sp.]